MDKKIFEKILKLIPVICLLLVPLYFVFEWCFAAGGFKRIYYGHIAYNNDNVRVVADEDFKLYEPVYSMTYTLNSSYYVSHRILLVPDSNKVPVDFEYKSEFLIELFEHDNRPLKSFRVDKFDKIYRRKGKNSDYYGNYMVYVGSQLRDAGSVYAFELGEIPFELVRLRWSRLKTMRVKVSVVTADTSLCEFCDNASLIIIPDLRL